MIALVPIPVALSRHVRARQTCFCAVFRSRTSASSRSRSAEERSMLISWSQCARLAHSPVSEESPFGMQSYDFIHWGACARRTIFVRANDPGAVENAS